MRPMPAPRPVLSLSLSLLALSPFGAAAQAPPPAPAPAPAPAIDWAQVDLGDVIDSAIRWLRARQGEDGSYGGSVEGTAWVLRALALSPRAYTRVDGPFVRGALDYLASRQNAAGYVHDEGADGEQAQIQTVLAFLGVAPYQDGASQALAARMSEPFGATLALPKPMPLTAEAARGLVGPLLAKRRADGSWNGPDGPIVETARAVLELSRAAAALRPPPASTRPVSALPGFSQADRAGTLAAIERGVRFLSQAGPEGRFGPPGRPDAGISAMALSALQSLPEPRPAEVQKAIDQGLAWLISLQDRDGSIHDGKLKNYITSAAVLALAKAGREEHLPVILRARDFLVALQADEGDGYSEGDLYYGGIGYGGDERPDLSNLHMALEALAAAGLEQGDPAFRRALKFLERTQNRSESNDVAVEREGRVIVSGDDGGAAYAPGESKAGLLELPDGRFVPRSYGSMTYALLKGYVLAGLPREDPRMQAAWKWIAANYTLDVNPGFEQLPDPSAGYQGLYYYFLAMARALDLYGQDVVVDAEGVEHAWRRDLSGRLIAMQRRDDGSWVNANSPRWWEGNPLLATSYALLTLESALPPASPDPPR